MCQGLVPLNSLYWGWSTHPTFNRNLPYNGYINPYYWVDDHPLSYGNNGSLDPSTYLGMRVSPGFFSGKLSALGLGFFNPKHVIVQKVTVTGRGSAYQIDPNCIFCVFLLMLVPSKTETGNSFKKKIEGNFKKLSTSFHGNAFNHFTG